MKYSEYIYLGYKRNPDPCIWFDELQQDLSSDILQQILNVVSDKWIIHDGSSVTLESKLPKIKFRQILDEKQEKYFMVKLVQQTYSLARLNKSTFKIFSNSNISFR